MFKPFNLKIKIKICFIDKLCSNHIFIKRLFKIGKIGVYLSNSFFDYLKVNDSINEVEIKKIKKIVVVKKEPIYLLYDENEKPVGDLTVLYSKQDKSVIGALPDNLILLNYGIDKFYSPFKNTEISANVGITNKHEFVVWDFWRNIIKKFKIGDVIDMTKDDFLIKNAFDKIDVGNHFSYKNKKKMYLEENKRIKFFKKNLKNNRFFKIKNEDEAKLVAFKYASFYL